MRLKEDVQPDKSQSLVSLKSCDIEIQHFIHTILLKVHCHFLVHVINHSLILRTLMEINTVGQNQHSVTPQQQHKCQ